MVPARPHDLSDLTVREITVPTRSMEAFGPLIGARRHAELLLAGRLAARRLEGRTVWNVSSTATGGGVAEMLQVLVGYVKDTGIDIRWLVMAGDGDFFSITKRVHNRLHGVAGDTGGLGPDQADHYRRVTDANVAGVLDRAVPGDVVLLHDPQTAGMAPALRAAGVRVVWRCHVGRQGTNRWTDEAWSFLRDHLDACEAYVFSLRRYAPSWMEESKVRVIPPSIDPFSPKNQEMSTDDVTRTLRHVGLLAGGGDDAGGAFTRSDGTPGRVERRASVVPGGAPTLDRNTPLVVQVSRWDRLKDMVGVLEGFALSGPGALDAHLALAGPAVAGVVDDPEGAGVFDECTAAWEALPSAVRRRVTLLTLPMEDVDENAAIVNALQRHATVIVQKSLEEGFGLTVAEGMWKGRALVASNVGGIAEQITPGTGILLDDPTDLSAFGAALSGLLARPDEIARIGARARQHVLEHFVGDEHLIRYARLVEWLVG